MVQACLIIRTASSCENAESQVLPLRSGIGRSDNCAEGRGTNTFLFSFMVLMEFKTQPSGDTVSFSEGGVRSSASIWVKLTHTLQRSEIAVKLIKRFENKIM